MFLLTPTIFLWDLAILILLSLFLCGCIICTLSRTSGKNQYQRVGKSILGLLSLIGFLTILYGSFIEPHTIVVTEEQIQVQMKTPLKIAVISDLELGHYKDHRFLTRVVKNMNAYRPDLVLIAGDFVFHHDIDLRMALAPLEKIRSSLGVYAVFGNHDSGKFRTLLSKTLYNVPDVRDEMEEILNDYNVKILRNENRRISLADEDLYIAGIEDMWSGEHDVQNALKGIPIASSVILLSHNPDVVSEEGSTRADLIISGHTHGGQVRLPFLGSVPKIPTSLGKQFEQGIFTFNTGNALAITRGIGETNVRARLFAWPEILLLHTTPLPPSSI